MALVNGNAPAGWPAAAGFNALNGPGAAGSGGSAGAGPGAAGSVFRDVFGQIFADANRQQLDAQRLNEQLVTGQVQDVAQVMLAAQKAELSLQLAIQVRNKLLEAYQEIMRMQV